MNSCIVAGKLDVRDFLQHISRGTYKCTQCDHPPNNLANVKSHVESKHFSPGYQCRFCGRTYAIEKTAKSHMKACQYLQYSRAK